MVGRNVRRLYDVYNATQHSTAQAIMVQLEQARQTSLKPAITVVMIIDLLQRLQTAAAAAAASTNRRFSAFGDVAIPIGGPGAGIITDATTQDPRRSMHFHSIPKKKCTAGVPVGHPSGKAGQCMYKH